MTSSAGPASAHDPPASDIYDPDEGDAVLILHLDGGRRPEISQEAGYRPLDHFSDGCQSGSDSEETMDDESEDEDGIRSNDMSPIPTSRFTKPVVETSAAESSSVPGSVDLRSLATDALAAAQAVSKTTDVDDLQSANHETQCSQMVSQVENSAIIIEREMPISNTKKPVLAPPISPYAVQSSPEVYSPRQHTPSQVLMHPNNVRSPASLPLGNHGELAPLQMASPRSDVSNHETLPSIRSQFFEQLHSSPKDLAVRPSPHFPHSPPTGPSRLGAISGNHTSPPISPNEAYRNSIPSPANTLPALSPYPYSSTNNHQSPPMPDYNSNGAKQERPSISQILTPPTDRIADRMSIDIKGCPRSEGGKGFKRKNEMIRHGLVHDSPGGQDTFGFIMSIRIKTIPHCVTCLRNAPMALIEAEDAVVGLDDVGFAFGGMGSVRLGTHRDPRGLSPIEAVHIGMEDVTWAVGGFI
ncbi:hypothetical protein EKO27_g7094 [Xylaria grammica]|uniref:Uncharacterized protein n=1 Tax=Xylaria grammica TaxID=363999 RepID=A0A439D0P3_9PEZI|nr:hypothetical protein EKO27_g7094 [Xylaria grammica]